MLLVSLIALGQPFVLCIDPGHPSEVNDGRTLQNGLREVTVCWQVAVELKGIAQGQGLRVVMTKSRESQLVTNKRRAEIANGARADLMLRLHADTGSGTGFATYFPNRQGTAHGKRGPKLSVIEASRLAAAAFHRAFAFSLSGVLRDNGCMGDDATAIGAKQGALTGSIFAEVPTLLVEMAFLSNRKDAEFVRSAEHRKRIAKALLDGVLAVRKIRGD